MLIVMLLLPIAACGGASMFAPDSFLSRFSLRRLVERQQSAFGLDCSSNAGGGGIGTGGGTSGGGGFRSHKGEGFTCRIKPKGDNDFNESRFIDALKTAVKKEIIESGAQIEGEDGTKGYGFVFRYRTEEVTGSVEIKGQRYREEQYTVEAEIAEWSKP